MKECLVHSVVKPGQLWKSSHALLLPRHKVGVEGAETYAMVVHLERRMFERHFEMHYVEATFLTEEGRIQRIKLMNCNGMDWYEEFLKLVDAKA